MDAQTDKTTEELTRKTRLVFLIRFLVALACALAIAFFEGGDIFSSPRFRYAYSLLLCLCILDLLYVPPLRLLPFRHAQVAVHLLFDIAGVTALVYLTGGFQSTFALLYFGPVLAGAYLLPLAPALAVTLLNAGGLVGVSLLFHVAPSPDGLPFIQPDIAESFLKGHEELFPLLGNLFLQSLAFLTVFLLGWRLLRRSDPERIVIEEIIESMGEGVITVDRNGTVALMNRSARDILGLSSRDTVLGRRLEDLLADRGDPRLVRRLLEGRQAPFEVLLPRAEGRPVAAVISTWPIVDDKKRARGTVAIVKDLTLEKEIEEMRKTADRLQGIREMAAGIAHEIRNPLASIRGSIQELTTGALVHEDDKKLMNIILKESDRLDNIITEFLDLTAKRSLSPRRVQLGGLLEEVAQLLRRRPERGEASVRMDVPPDLEVRVDVEQMKQVFFNLGLNALQAMRDGGVLHIAAHLQEAYPSAGQDGVPGRKVPGAAVAFMDTGPGIDAETLPKILMPFFSTKPKGTGIGLSLVQRSVHAHSGTLTVDSVPGTGSTFTVWIPLDMEAAEASSTSTGA